MFTEDELIPISALQHWVFCPRQCALIHLDRAWSDNALTASGRILHERTHKSGAEWHGAIRVVRSLPLRSLQFGLVGLADVVEFHPPDPDTPAEQQTTIPSLKGHWSVFPIEYKRGRPKKNDCDRVQLCAQALCLEEMLGVVIPAGALYYGKTKRRTDVSLDEHLRNVTLDVARQVRLMLGQQQLPPPDHSRKCRSCSLNDACMPRRVGRSRPVADNYIKRMVAAALTGDTTEQNHEDT